MKHYVETILVYSVLIEATCSKKNSVSPFRSSAQFLTKAQVSVTNILSGGIFEEKLRLLGL
jgi:hypothetical protein